MRKTEGYKRNHDDFFETPAECTVALMDAEHRRIPLRIWDPCVGKGAICNQMPGREWIATDLIDRGYGRGGIDFLMERTRLADAIIMNPPFKLLQKFIMKALYLEVPYIAVFHPTLFINTLGWSTIWQKRPPRRMYSLSWRPDIFNIGTPDQRCCFMWSVWDSEGEWLNNPTTYQTIKRPK